jgi:outer membrane protein OmpA-like peptidoglycan-associated protein
MVNRSFRIPSLEQTQENPFWLSVGDLMSGLLLVFVLILFAVLHQLFQRQEAQRNTREAMIQRLQQELQRSKIDVIIDRQGTITIKESVLFDSGQSILKPKGQRFLNRFLPVYSKVLFSKREYRREIVRVVVEGHTDRQGTFSRNLRLSMTRSLTVSNYILARRFRYKKELRERLLCSGRGELDANQKRTLFSDRKVLFRIQFRDIKFLDVWRRFLSGGN